MVLLFVCVLFMVSGAHAQTHVHETEESFHRSGYEFFWGVIQEEFDAREFEDESDAARYKEMIDVVMRTGAVYAQPYRNIRFGMYELYEQILELDEDPPLYVQYRYHGTVAQKGSPAPSEAYRAHADALVRIADRMDEAGYPAYVVGATWIRAAEYYRDAELESLPEAIRAREQGIDELVRASRLTDIAPEHREFVAERLSNFGWKYSALNDRDKELFCERLLTDSGVDAWVAHFAYGKLLMDRGWDVRGDGWAYEVSRKDWERFGQLMGEAYAHLIQAWEAHPEWVNTQAQLINISMGAGIDPQRDEHYWFQDAMRYRMDHGDSWDRYARALMPRWSGSREQMYAQLDLAIDLHLDPVSMLYIAMNQMSMITTSEEDAHLVLLDPEYLNVVTQLMRDELEDPTPYKNIWQQRLALRTLAMGQYKSGNLVVASELLRAGGGMTDSVWYPWAETQEFTRFAPLLSTSASDQIIASLRALGDQDLKVALRASKDALRELERTPPESEIHGDPIQILEQQIESIQARIPHVPLWETRWFQVSAGCAIALMVLGLFLRRVVGAKHTA